MHVLRIVKPEVDAAGETERLRQAVETIVGARRRFHYHVKPSETITEGIRLGIEQQEPQLLVIGASAESRIRNVLFGSIPDVVSRAPCSWCAATSPGTGA